MRDMLEFRVRQLLGLWILVVSFECSGLQASVHRI